MQNPKNLNGAPRPLPHAVVRAPGAPPPLGLAAATICRHLARMFVTVCRSRLVRRPPPYPAQAVYGVLQPTLREERAKPVREVARIMPEDRRHADPGTSQRHETPTTARSNEVPRHASEHTAFQ
jgi:hypothetical protein